MTPHNIDEIREFYERHRSALFAYAVSVTRSVVAAEDVVHGVFAEVLARVIMPEELRPYVFRAIRNRSVDVLRRSQRMEQHFDESAEDASVPSVEMRILAQEALAMLNDVERETVVLKIYGDLTFAEIGEVLGESMNTAASRYRRSLEKMREQIEEVPHEG